jgi:hypothetical protein
MNANHHIKGRVVTLVLIPGDVAQSGSRNISCRAAVPLLVGRLLDGMTVDIGKVAECVFVHRMCIEVCLGEEK